MPACLLLAATGQHLHTVRMCRSAVDPACRRGSTGRIKWAGVAAELGSVRKREQCKDKWRRMRLAGDAAAGQSGLESEDESEEEDGPHRQQPRAYKFWSEAEADTAAQLLGAVGARLARDRSFAITAPTLPDKLRAAVSLLYLVFRF